MNDDLKKVYDYVKANPTVKTSVLAKSIPGIGEATFYRRLKELRENGMLPNGKTRNYRLPGILRDGTLISTGYALLATTVAPFKDNQTIPSLGMTRAQVVNKFAHMWANNEAETLTIIKRIQNDLAFVALAANDLDAFKEYDTSNTVAQLEMFPDLTN